MKRAFLISSVLALVAITSASAQRGGFGGGRGGFGGMGGGRPQPQLAPEVPGPEVDGPPDSALATALMRLTPTDGAHYAQLRDSFMVATKTERDSALDMRGRMYAKLDEGDHDGATYLLEQLNRTAKVLKDQMGKFEDRLSKVITSDEMKDYKKWKKDQEQEVDDRRQRDASRWRGGRGGYARGGGRLGEEGPEGGMGGGGSGGGGYDRPVEQKTAIETSGPKAALGSNALRIGREVYVTGQVSVDSSGAIVGAGDLAAQSQRAFNNLLAVLGSARAGPLDVVRLTIYVVNYDPKDLDVIKSAAAPFLASRNPPVVNILGVQSLSRPGLLISVEAMALANLAR
jgi:enamine deaminase RidA (YjgF/YER057c/UK114 family)